MMEDCNWNMMMMMWLPIAMDKMAMVMDNVMGVLKLMMIMMFLRRSGNWK